jgi:hypothetical protein
MAIELTSSYGVDKKHNVIKLPDINEGPPNLAESNAHLKPGNNHRLHTENRPECKQNVHWLGSHSKVLMTLPGAWRGRIMEIQR